LSRVLRSSFSHCKSNEAAHTFSEDIVKSCAVDMAHIFWVIARKLDVTLTNATVRSKIDDLSIDIRDTLIANLKALPYKSLQLDECADVSNVSQLICFVPHEKEKNV